MAAKPDDIQLESTVESSDRPSQKLDDVDLGRSCNVEHVPGSKLEKRLLDAVNLRNKRDRYKIIHNVKAETIRVALDYIVYTDINGNVLKLSHNISDENVDTLVKYILTKSHTKDVVGVDVSKIIESEPLKYSTEVLRITSCNDTPFMKFSYWEAFMFYFCFFMQFMILSLISNNSDAVVVPCDSFGLAMVRFFIAAYVSIMLPRSMNMMIKRKFLTLNKSWSSHFKMVLRYILFLAECVISFIVSCIDRDWERVYAAQVGIFDFLINLLTLVTSIQLTLREGTVLPSLFTFTGFLLIGELDDLFGEMMKLDYTHAVLSTETMVSDEGEVIDVDIKFVKEEVLSTALSIILFFFTFISLVSTRP